MNKKDRAILYGLAIGDGHINYRSRLKDGKYRYEQAEMRLGHGEKQLEYLNYKVDLLHSIFGGNRVKVSKKYYTLSNGKTYVGYAAGKTNKYFRQMHKYLYTTDKKKIITPKVLDFMDSQSLALWFMDDGSITPNYNKEGIITSVSFRICTQCSEEEAKTIVDWLDKSFGISCKYYLAKSKYDIGGGTSSTLQLVNTIFDFIHNSMFYKIKPLANLIIRKSAQHPYFSVDDDIVRTVQNKMCSVEE